MGVFGADRDPELFLFTPDLNIANRVERLAGLLAARGHSDAPVEKIIGGNFARTLGDIWTADAMAPHARGPAGCTAVP